jgi:hypothetical protein
MSQTVQPRPELDSPSEVAAIDEERRPIIDRLEAIITQDTGGRGLAVVPHDNLVTRCRGNLARAAGDLATEGTSIAIVTGFYVAHAATPSIETDGPCGALALAWFLARLGCQITLITDRIGAGSIEAGLRALALEPSQLALEIFPFDHDADDGVADSDRSSNDRSRSAKSVAYTDSFFRTGPGVSLSHLIAIERAGPSWPDAGNADMARAGESPGPQPADHAGHVHNFRGKVITPWTAKTHLLFDFIRDNHLPVRTIGIGDGGNEIGMGSIPQQVIHANIPNGLGARIACRVATDWTIACGVSNWGAYALGSAVACLRDRPEYLAEWSDEREQSILRAMVDAGAVDGVTGKQSLSVDGLPIEEHLAIWGQIRDAVRRSM